MCCVSVGVVYAVFVVAVCFNYTPLFLLITRHYIICIIGFLRFSSFRRSHGGIVTCVAAGVNNTLAISGSEDSTIAISDIHSGRLVSRTSKY